MVLFSAVWDSVKVSETGFLQFRQVQQSIRELMIRQIRDRIREQEIRKTRDRIREPEQVMRTIPEIQEITELRTAMAQNRTQQQMRQRYRREIQRMFCLMRWQY